MLKCRQVWGGVPPHPFPLPQGGEGGRGDLRSVAWLGREPLPLMALFWILDWGFWIC